MPFEIGEKVMIADIPEPPAIATMLWEFHLLMKWRSEEAELVVVGRLNNTLLLSDNDQQIYVPFGWIKKSVLLS